MVKEEDWPGNEGREEDRGGSNERRERRGGGERRTETATKVPEPSHFDAAPALEPYVFVAALSPTFTYSILENCS